MRQITVSPNQTIFDIAVQCYGTCEAIGEILLLNPNIVNSDEERNDNFGEFFLELSLKAGSVLTIDPDSIFVVKSTAKELVGKTVTTDDKQRNYIPTPGHFYFGIPPAGYKLKTA